MIKRFFPAFLLIAVLLGPALAQQAPYVYPISIGTSSIQVIGANAARKKLIFHNPNDTAKIAVCPIGPTRVAGGGTTNITAVINGSGCLTLLPYQSQEITGGTPSGPQQAMPSAWVGIASAGGSALTILEFE